ITYDGVPTYSVSIMEFARIMWRTRPSTSRTPSVRLNGGQRSRSRCMPSLITAGPDGALWCTLNQADAIARITADGGITTFALPTAGAAPVGIDAGAEAVWVAEIGAGQVAR